LRAIPDDRAFIADFRPCWSQTRHFLRNYLWYNSATAGRLPFPHG
jgi:hypothetical protein